MWLHQPAAPIACTTPISKEIIRIVEQKYRVGIGNHGSAIVIQEARPEVLNDVVGSGLCAGPQRRSGARLDSRELATCPEGPEANGNHEQIRDAPAPRKPYKM